MVGNAAYDVTGIGNAIVDVLARVEDDFLTRENLRKGAMMLIDAPAAEAFYGKLGQCRECSGGSVANSIAALASLGAKTAFIGRVRNDDMGRIFRHDMQGIGVHYPTPQVDGGSPTARCYVCVTPDGERTMNTYIGACAELEPEDIDDTLITSSAVTYIEGYLWDQPAAKEAIRKALKLARGAGRKVAFSLSDVFCVERHREEFHTLLASGIDIVFANEQEATALYMKNDLSDALAMLGERVPLAVVTQGADGAYVVTGSSQTHVPGSFVREVVDTTGAGDLFAAGFLYGMIRGWPYEESAKLGHRCASQIIRQLGARSLEPLDALVA